MKAVQKQNKVKKEQRSLFNMHQLLDSSVSLACPYGEAMLTRMPTARILLRHTPE